MVIGMLKIDTSQRSDAIRFNGLQSAIPRHNNVDYRTMWAINLIKYVHNTRPGSFRGAKVRLGSFHLDKGSTEMWTKNLMKSPSPHSELLVSEFLSISFKFDFMRFCVLNGHIFSYVWLIASQRQRCNRQLLLLMFSDEPRFTEDFLNSRGHFKRHASERIADVNVRQHNTYGAVHWRYGLGWPWRTYSDYTSSQGHRKITCYFWISTFLHGVVLLSDDSFIQPAIEWVWF